MRAREPTSAIVERVTFTCYNSGRFSSSLSEEIVNSRRLTQHGKACLMRRPSGVPSTSPIACWRQPPRRTTKPGVLNRSRGTLGQARLLGLMLPAEAGGAGLGPRTFAAVTAALAGADAYVAMVYVMHVLGAAAISAARPGAAMGAVPSEIAAGLHLATLAFSEAGSPGTFGRPCPGRAETATACSSPPANYGLPALVTRRAISSRPLRPRTIPVN
jgi:hypothetical protein